MNGRLYDPALGRMLSADNYVQDPLSTQNYNRYSYVLNNPLSYNDPDGQFWNFVIGGVAGGISGWQIGKAQGARGWGMVGYIFGGAAIGLFTSGMSAGVAAASAGLGTVGSGIVTGAVTGFMSGGYMAALGGNDFLKGGFKGAAWGGAIGGSVGGFTKNLGQDNISGLKRYIKNPENWIAQNSPSVAWTNNLSEVVIRQPWWQKLGLSISSGLSAILTLPLIVEGDVSKSRPNNYTLLYRNMSVIEYDSFRRKGQNFGYGLNSLEGSKQFWITQQGLEMWHSTNLAGPFDVTVSVPTKIIGPNGIVQLQTLDGHLAGTVRPTNMNTFNRVKIVIKVNRR